MGADALVTKDVERVAACIAAGGLAVVPTETVYGLAADAEQPAAVARMFAVKGRPPTHPLIVHIGAADDLDRWVDDVPPPRRSARRDVLAGAADVAPAADRLVSPTPSPAAATPSASASRPTRRRSRCWRGTGGGLAAPSANRYGAVSPTTVGHVLDELGDVLDPATDVILDGGPSPVGVESTIVDCTVDPPQILRPGGIPTETVAELIGTPIAAAERALTSGRDGGLALRPAGAGPPRRPARSTPTAAASRLGAAGIEVRVIDGTDDLVRYARNLYAELRDADADGCTDIIAVLPPPIGLGHAIRDRLQKAAAR